MNCACGCGGEPAVAMRNWRAHGVLKGKRMRFVRGHRPGVPGPGPRWVEEDRGFETPCRIWQGVKIPLGYGRITRDGKKALVHVVVFEAAHGPVPDGYEVDHRCGQRDCGRLDHLEAVTHAENCRRGRATKLVVEQVQAIRASSETGPVLAARFGVSRSTIYAIRSRRLWAGV